MCAVPRAAKRCPPPRGSGLHGDIGWCQRSCRRCCEARRKQVSVVSCNALRCISLELQATLSSRRMISLHYIWLVTGDFLLEHDKKTPAMQAAVRNGSSEDVPTTDMDQQHAAIRIPVAGSFRERRSSPKSRKTVAAEAASSAEMRKVSGRQKRANLKLVDFVS